MSCAHIYTSYNIFKNKITNDGKNANYVRKFELKKCIMPTFMLTCTRCLILRYGVDFHMCTCTIEVATHVFV